MTVKPRARSGLAASRRSPYRVAIGPIRATRPTIHREILTLLIFGTTLLAVLIRPRKLSEGAAASIGAAAMLLAGIVHPADLGTVLRDNLPVLSFFLGMMTLTTPAEGADVFERLALPSSAASTRQPTEAVLQRIPAWRAPSSPPPAAT